MAVINPQTKPKVPYLPYQQEPGAPQMLPLTQQAAQVNQPQQVQPQTVPGMVQPQQVQPVQSGYAPAAGGQQVLQAAQQAAVQGAQAPTLQAAQGTTLGLLQQPGMGIDPAQQRQQAEEAYDIRSAQALETARQGMADISRHGPAVDELLDIALRQSRERTEIGRGVEAQAGQEQWQRTLDALGQARAQAEQERLGYETNIGALTGTVAAGEPSEQRAYDAANDAINRGMALAQQFGDQQFQDHMARLQGNIQMGMLTTQLDWQSIDNDLNRQLDIAMQNNDIASQMQILQMKQDFEGVQAEANRQNAIEIQTMINEQDQWKINRAEDLTRAGWDVEAAQATADREHQTFMQEYDGALQKYLQSGMIEAEAQQAAEQRAMIVSEARLSRQLTREVEQGRLSMEEARLAEEVGMFKDELGWKQRAMQMGLDDAAATRIWEAGERALDRSHDLMLQDMQVEFAREGIAWETVTASIQSMEPEQAAAFVKGLADEHDIDIPDYTGIPTNQAADLLTRVQAGEQITADDYAKLKEYGNITAQTDTPIAGDYGSWTTWTYDARNTREGKRALRFTDSAWGWLSEHKGDLVTMDDGEVYRILNFWEPGAASSDKNKRAYITFENVQTGATKTLGGGSV